MTVGVLLPSIFIEDEEMDDKRALGVIKKES